MFLGARDLQLCCNEARVCTTVRQAKQRVYITQRSTSPCDKSKTKKTREEEEEEEEEEQEEQEEEEEEGDRCPEGLYILTGVSLMLMFFLFVRLLTSIRLQHFFFCPRLCPRTWM